MSDPAERPNRRPWPPIIYGAAVIASIALGFVLPLPLEWLAWGLRLTAGMALIAAAVAFEIRASRAMKAAATTIMPHRRSSHLVTSGPFAWSRNPLYVGLLVASAGVGLVAGSLWALVALPLEWALLRWGAVLPEEQYLAAKFGAAYTDYTGRVRRWL